MSFVSYLRPLGITDGAQETFLLYIKVYIISMNSVLIITDTLFDMLITLFNYIMVIYYVFTFKELKHSYIALVESYS